MNISEFSIHGCLKGLQFRSWKLAGTTLLMIILVIAFSPNGRCSDNDSLELHIGEAQLHIGGALRFNYNLSSWKKQQLSRGGDFGFDLFRVNVKLDYRKFGLNAEYRFYSKDFGGAMLKQGWIEYSPNEENSIHIGLTQVPFGIQQYNSHNWFFNIGYYIGLEDDHDMGIKYILSKEKFELQLAYFKNGEEYRFGNETPASYDRYSYDVTGRNKEVHQGNLKFKYLFGHLGSSEIGFSVMYGGLYNIINGQIGNHNAVAAFYESDVNRWNVKLQGATFANNPADSSQYLQVIEMGAYGAPYDVSAKGYMFTAAISYELPFKKGPIDDITFYNDFGLISKSYDHASSIMNVTGALIHSGYVYAYVDVATGRNHAWLGPQWSDAFANGDENAKFHVRFNINIGVYY
jgi:hypothetical protein